MTTRVLIDAIDLGPRSGGVLTYLRENLRAMARLRPGWDWIVLTTPAGADVLSNVQGIRFRVASSAWASLALRPLRARSCVGAAARAEDASLLWSPHNQACLAWRGPQVVTLQAPLRVGPLRRALGVRSIRNTGPRDWAIQRTLASGAYVIAVSDFLRRHLLKVPGADGRRIVTVLEGTTSRVRKVSATDSRRADVLFVSTLFPYKNAAQVVRAFGRLLENEPAGLGDLVVVGKDPDGQQHRHLRRLVRDLHVPSDRVRLCGRVDDAELAGFYSKAAAFVFPSRIETFGLPPLEAMDADVPVIASNRCSVPEVVGDAALIIDPDKPEHIESALRRIFTDSALRTTLVRQGRQRVAELTWKRSAEATLSVMDRALEERDA